MRRKTIDTIPVLSSCMKTILTSFSKSRSLPGGLIKRSAIILLAAHGLTNQDISLQVDLHFNHVATWRNRFLKALPALQEIEAHNPEKLASEIKNILSDRRRQGKPSSK